MGDVKDTDRPSDVGQATSLEKDQVDKNSKDQSNGANGEASDLKKNDGAETEPDINLQPEEGSLNKDADEGRESYLSENVSSQTDIMSTNDGLTQNPSTATDEDNTTTPTGPIENSQNGNILNSVEPVTDLIN